MTSVSFFKSLAFQEKLLLHVNHVATIVYTIMTVYTLSLCTVNFPWLVSVVIHRFPAFPEPRGSSVLKRLVTFLALFLMPFTWTFSWCHLSNWVIHLIRFPGDTATASVDFFFPKNGLSGGASNESCLWVWIICAQVCTVDHASPLGYLQCCTDVWAGLGLGRFDEGTLDSTRFFVGLHLSHSMILFFFLWVSYIVFLSFRDLTKYRILQAWLAIAEVIPFVILFFITSTNHVLSSRCHDEGMPFLIH